MHVIASIKLHAYDRRTNHFVIGVAIHTIFSQPQCLSILLIGMRKLLRCLCIFEIKLFLVEKKRNTIREGRVDIFQRQKVPEGMCFNLWIPVEQKKTEKRKKNHKIYFFCGNADLLIEEIVPVVGGIVSRFTNLWFYYFMRLKYRFGFHIRVKFRLFICTIYKSNFIKRDSEKFLSTLVLLCVAKYKLARFYLCETNRHVCNPDKS